MPAPTPATPPIYFASPAAFREWLAAHHESAPELWVGYFKRHTGRASLTWPESVDEALCYGWIDGIRRSVDGDRYVIRFTPRRSTSTWSDVNIRRVAVLTAEGRMTEAGLAAFRRREEARSRAYTYEQPPKALPRAWRDALAADPHALADFRARPPWYRRTAVAWVMSAKREATRQRRFDQLVACAAKGEPIPQLARPARSK